MIFDKGLIDFYNLPVPSAEELVQIEDARASMELIRKIIIAIRKIDPSKKSKDVYLHMRSDVSLLQLTCSDNVDLVGGMTGTTELHLMDESFVIDNSNEFTTREKEFDIFVFGEHLESIKVNKKDDRAKIQKQIEKLKQQLDNDVFLAKAPVKVIEDAKASLKDLELMN